MANKLQTIFTPNREDVSMHFNNGGELEVNTGTQIDIISTERMVAFFGKDVENISLGDIRRNLYRHRNSVEISIKK